MDSSVLCIDGKTLYEKRNFPMNSVNTGLNYLWHCCSYVHYLFVSVKNKKY